MDWYKIEIEFNEQAGEAVIAVLYSHGAGGVITDKDGCRMKVTAYYPFTEDFPAVYRDLRQKINGLNGYNLNPGNIDYRLEVCRDEDWTTSWHKYFQPTEVGKNFLICPEWENCENGERIVIYINPGVAFGIGGHITTRMAISLLEKYAGDNRKYMLDMGTGTGILSIAAAGLGIEEITAVDNDRAALKAARKNIVRNGAADRIIVKESNLFSRVEGKYDLVTANMLPTILLKLFPDIINYLFPGGIVILSGVNDKYEEQIYSRIKTAGLKVIEKRQSGDWQSAVLGRG